MGMEKNENETRQSVRVILDHEGERPSCNHGPMLLFERSSDGGKRFYACSAYRDRKLCPAYILESVWAKENSRKTLKVHQENPLLSKSAVLHSLRENFLKENNLGVISLGYCHSCGELIKDKENHLNHKVTSKVDYLLNRPSQFLDPLDNSKKEAQYFFTDTSIKAVLGVIEDTEVSHILCIACPTIFEALKNTSMKECLMLDIDVRFRQFYETKEFLLYNMFNHYFFDGLQGTEIYDQFIKEGKNSLAIVMDPPFGGKVEIIAHTFKSIDADYKRLNGENALIPAKFWIFPYFMEHQILTELPQFAMLDYKIEYANHTNFQKGPKGRKQGSPVRIFTNVSLEQLGLPVSEGYSYCSRCKKWISPENRHCDLCDSCTSKDGRTYVHCMKCKRCVKPTWSHCMKCNRCALTEHPCDLFQQKSIEVSASKKRKLSISPSKLVSTSLNWKVTNVVK